MICVRRMFCGIICVNVVCIRMLRVCYYYLRAKWRHTEKCMFYFKQKIKSYTLGFQINVQVQINVRAGKFATNNKRTGPNEHTNWKIYQWKLTGWHKNSVKILVFCEKYMKTPKIIKRTVPNKSVWSGKILEINKRTPYIYLEP